MKQIYIITLICLVWGFTNRNAYSVSINDDNPGSSISLVLGYQFSPHNAFHVYSPLLNEYFDFATTNDSQVLKTDNIVVEINNENDPDDNDPDPNRKVQIAEPMDKTVMDGSDRNKTPDTTDRNQASDGSHSFSARIIPSDDEDDNDPDPNRKVQIAEPMDKTVMDGSDRNKTGNGVVRNSADNAEYSKIWEDTYQDGEIIEGSTINIGIREMPSRMNNTFKSAPNLYAFPNPSSEFIQVSGLDATCHYKIYTMAGAAIKQGVVSNLELLRVGDLPTGVYFLKTDNGSSVKFIKE